MGILLYGAGMHPTRIPDRLLAHLKVIVMAKFRRGEGFPLSVRRAAGESPGRTAIWLERSIPLQFVFDSAEPEVLDLTILQSLASEANSASGPSLDLSTTLPAADLLAETSA